MALDTLRLTFPTVPFVGMVPAVKPAVMLTQSGVVGVMATAATLKGRLLRDVTERYAQHTTVIGQACHGLVDFVEAGDLHSPALKARIHEHLEPLLVAGADVIVLGCTHYPFLQDAIQAAAPHVTLIDPAPAVARQTLTVAQHGADTSAGAHGQTLYFTTGSADYFAWQLHALGLPEGPVQSVSLEELL
jgi:glutamate racemase